MTDCPSCYGRPRGECPNCGTRGIEWDSGVRKEVWLRFVYDGNYGELLREKVKQERLEQGLSETVEIIL